MLAKKILLHKNPDPKGWLTKCDCLNVRKIMVSLAELEMCFTPEHGDLDFLLNILFGHIRRVALQSS